jgi:seryl-tRNA synthetase
MLFILPDEAALIRRIESLALHTAAAFGFEEVIFPRSLPLAQWTEVAESLGPLSGELKSELVTIPDLGGAPTALCHWQCEPYYLALRELGPRTPARVVDRSGWSYRNEARIGAFRPREFLRVEMVWRGTCNDVSALQSSLMNAFEQMFEQLSLPVQRMVRDDEMRNSSQRLVEDLVFIAADGGEIEIVGSHLHGDAFVRRFWPDAPADMETACMGLSLSRTAALLSASVAVDRG